MSALLMNPDEGISMLESFLYHPLSFVWSEQDNTIKAKDRVVADMLVRHNATLRKPPGRADFSRTVPPSYDYTALVSHWAHARRMTVVRRNHFVACPETKEIFVVDYVMESDTDDYLVVVYYAEKRGGPLFEESACYLRTVEQVCNKHMHFYPNCISLCIYGDGTRDARLYGKFVNGGDVDTWT